MNDPYFFKPEQRTLENLLKIDLSSAFSWANTKEGGRFWASVCESKLQTAEDLRNFLKENLVILDPNFIELELYI